jgi:hypothetical protein
MCGAGGMGGAFAALMVDEKAKVFPNAAIDGASGKDAMRPGELYDEIAPPAARRIGRVRGNDMHGATLIVLQWRGSAVRREFSNAR